MTICGTGAAMLAALKSSYNRAAHVVHERGMIGGGAPHEQRQLDGAGGESR